MENNKQFTIIIHGPLTVYTMFSLFRHADHAKIVLTFPTPTDSSTALFKQIINMASTSNGNISLISYGNIVPDAVDNRQNKYLHFSSVETALNLCNTEFVVKHRSDEFYTDLLPFYDAIKSNSNKIVTTDVFFRNSTMPFHPSDHLVGGTLKSLKEIFSLAKNYTEVPMEDLVHPFFDIIRKSPGHTNIKIIASEQYLGVAAVINYLNDSDSTEDVDVVSLMKQSFHIVNTEKLGFFRVAFNSKKNPPHEYFDISYRTSDTDISDIKYYE
jgi:hypothetical protein